MSETKQQSHCGGITFPMLLFLVFLTLKLCGKVAWSWLWVTAPLWGGAALLLTIIVLAVAVGAAVGASRK